MYSSRQGAQSGFGMGGFYRESMVRPVHAPAIAIASALALAPWRARDRNAGSDGEARTKRGGMWRVCRVDWHPRRQVETHHP